MSNAPGRDDEMDMRVKVQSPRMRMEHRMRPDLALQPRIVQAEVRGVQYKKVTV